MIQGDSIGKQYDPISRQLPLRQFRAELNRRDKDDIQSHTRWAGCLLAEVLVRQKLSVEELSKEQLERYRKLYQVPKWQMPTFIRACKRAIPFETSWQYHPTESNGQ